MPTPESITHALNLAEAVQYNPGAVVSRTLLNKPAGTLTLFSFDAGQTLSEHTAPFDAVAHILDGAAEIIIAGQSYRLQAGELILMPANQPHAVKAPTRFKMLLTMFREPPA